MYHTKFFSQPVYKHAGGICVWHVRVLLKLITASLPLCFLGVKKHPNKENIGKIIEVLWAGFFVVVVLFIFPVITLEFLLGIVMEIYLA